MRRTFVLSLAVALPALLSIFGLTRGLNATPASAQVVGIAPSLRYTALGDSITNAGYLPEAERYPNLYAASISSVLAVPVTVNNLGLAGLFSNQLLDHLKNDPVFRIAVAGANVITVMIGINDFSYARALYLKGACGGSDNQDCLRSARHWLKANLTGIVAEIKSLNTLSGTRLLLADFYYPQISTDVASGNQAVLGPYVNQMSSDIHDVASTSGLSVANAYQAFNGADGTSDPNAKGYKMLDGAHPNAQGQAVIASLFGAFNGALRPPCGGADFNGDGRVTILDLMIAVSDFGTPKPDSSGPYTALDILRALQNFGQTC